MPLALPAGMRPALLAPALALLVTVDGGCAHFAPATTSTQMVEVTDGSIVPGQPPPPPPPRRPMTRRRELFIVGGVLTAFGAVATSIGLGFFLGGKREEAQEDCPHHPEQWLCGLGSAIDESVGATVLAVGVPHLVAGVIVLGAGAREHR